MKHSARACFEQRIAGTRLEEGDVSLMRLIAAPRFRYHTQVYINSQSFVWVFITMWVVFGVSSALMGTWGRIPFVADAADQQVR